jgi:hypothetical protein
MAESTGALLMSAFCRYSSFIFATTPQMLTNASEYVVVPRLLEVLAKGARQDAKMLPLQGLGLDSDRFVSILSVI